VILHGAAKGVAPGLRRCGLSSFHKFAGVFFRRRASVDTSGGRSLAGARLWRRKLWGSRSAGLTPMPLSFPSSGHMHKL